MKCPRCRREMHQIRDYNEQEWKCPFCGEIAVCILDYPEPKISTGKELF